MEKAIYERHLYEDTVLPFLYHHEKMAPESCFSGRLHWHENLEFLRCTKGEGEAINSGNRHTFLPGELVSVNTNELHSFKHKHGVGIEYDCLIIDSLFCKENGIPIDSVRFSSHINDPAAAVLYDRAYNACESEGDFKKLCARTAVLDFLLYMCRNHLSSQHTQPSSPNAEQIKKAVKHIKDNYMNPLSLTEVSSVAGFSAYYFSREFKKFTGTTFVSFLNNLRCERAAAALRQGATVTEACFGCGFNDVGYFSRTFLKVMGAPPSHYKNKGHL